MTPQSHRKTEHDDRHCETCTRLFDTDSKGLSKDDLTRQILGIVSAAEPERTRWTTEVPVSRRRRLSSRRQQAVDALAM